jgi:hypothetical protein
VPAQPVEREDRRRAVGHADVDVQRGRRRARDEPAEHRDDRGVALLVDVHDVAERGGGVQARADDARAARAQRAAQRAQVVVRLGRVQADRRLQLELGLVGVRREPSVLAGAGEPREHLAAGVRERVRVRVDEEKLLLDAEAEAGPATEVDLRDAVGHARVPYARA